MGLLLPALCPDEFVEKRIVNPPFSSFEGSVVVSTRKYCLQDAPNTACRLVGMEWNLVPDLPDDLEWVPDLPDDREWNEGLD